MYFCGMFIRKKKNPSGVISVQIIDKSKGKYKVVHTIGSSKDDFLLMTLLKRVVNGLKFKVGLQICLNKKQEKRKRNKLQSICCLILKMC